MTAILEELGAMSVSIRSVYPEQTFDDVLPTPPCWPYQNLMALFGSETGFSKLAADLARSLPEYATQLTPLEDRDWERVWIDQFVPQQISSTLWVVPSWTAPPDVNAVNLIIDPGLAFGTGTHPTTRMCLQSLAEMPLQGKRVLDYGCGSGILSVAALKLGASCAVATDLDTRALKTCRENARVNGCAKKMMVVPPEKIVETAGGRPFDIVVANILAPSLLSLRERLCHFLCPDGVILLSGILTQQANAVEKAYVGLDFIHKTQLDWVLLVGGFTTGTIGSQGSMGSSLEWNLR